LTGVGFSSLRTDRRGVEEETAVAVIFGGSSYSPSCSASLPLFRLGDGDRDEAIHVFRAKVANDSDTVLVLSRVALEIEGTGGISLGVVWPGWGDSCLSGDPFTRCIQDLGRATNDFLLPTRSSLGLSSFVGVLSIPSFADLDIPSSDDTGDPADATRYICWSLYVGLSRDGIELKLADLGSSESCLGEGRA